MNTKRSLYQCRTDHVTTSRHVLEKLKVKRGCTVPSRQTWPSTKKPDDTETSATTGSVDGCSVMPETQFVGTRLRVDTRRILSVGCFLPPIGTIGMRPEYETKPPLWVPFLIVPRCYLLRSFSIGDTSSRQRGFEISFPSHGCAAKGH